MRRFLAPLAALLCLASPVVAGQVVFNEVMYHPAGSKPEFVEITNLTSNRIDMAKWKLRGGVDYTFPDFDPLATTAHILKEYERIIVSSASEMATRAAYPSIPPFTRVYGPWNGQLNNAGDTIILDDAAGANQSALTYSDGGNWPVAADGTGHSLLLINQNREIDDWRNWKHSTVNGGTPGNPEVTQAETPVIGNLELSVIDYTTAVNYTSPWKYWRAATDPDGANSEGTWKGIAFDDTAWPGPGNGFFGHEPGTATLGSQIQTSFTTGYVSGTMSYYFRTTFNWSGLTTGTEFVLDQFVDDGVIYWLNGQELKGPNLGRVRMNGGTAAHGTGANGTPAGGDATDEQSVLTGTLDGQLVSGTNYLCAEVHQSGAASTDVYFGARLKIGIPQPAGVVINEVKPSLQAGQGFVEFYNPTGAAIDLNGWYLSDTAANLTKFRISASLVVPSLGLATIGFAESSLTLADPLVIYLTQPNGTTRQTAVSIPAPPTDGRSVGRKPAGATQWFFFTSATPGTPNQSAASGTNPLKLSEVHFTPADRVDWIEIANPSPAAFPGTGLFVASRFDFSDKVAIPASIPGNGFASAVVDFPADGSGDIVLFLIDASNNVVDAVELNHRAGLDSAQLFPMSGGEWYRTASHTQNAANSPARRTEIVINEIMYDPPSKHTQGEYIEFVNRSGGTVSLTGWSLTRGLDYAFPAGTTINPGEFIVVAKDPAFITATYGPGVRVFGPAEGQLGNKGDFLRLEDANGNMADTVNYKDGGNWPALAAAGGSSLELMHPDMDNIEASSWRASDESNKTSFEPFTHTGTYKQLRGAPTVDTGYKELLLNLVSDGHVVMDSISLTRAAAPGTNLLVNGDATSHTGSGASGFFCLGTHRLSDTVGGDFHLISTGGGDTKGNKVEVDVLGMQTNDQLTFSFQGRWISGNPLLVVQTWDRSFGKVFRLPIPNNLGTPGAANSKAAAAAPPAVDGILHSPAVPSSTSPVIVTARVSSAAGLSSVELRERLDTATFGGTWNTMAMNDGGTGGDAVAGDGVWSVTVPPRGDGVITQFYVRATALNGQVNECPRNAEGVNRVNGSVLEVPRQSAMWIVDNSPPSSQPGTLIERYVFSVFDRNAMTTATGSSSTYDWDYPEASNFGLNATIIINESDIRYNCELRKGGSPWTRNGGNSMERARWRTPADNLFRGRARFAIDSDGSITNAASRFHNRISRYMMYLFGYPVPDAEFVQQIVNADAPGWRDNMELTDSEFFERAYGDGGELYEIDDAWFMYDTNFGDDRLDAGSVTGRWFLTDWTNAAAGANPSAESPIYFHGNWPVRFPEARYDYASLSSFIKVAYNNNTGVSAAQEAAFREQMERYIDVDRAAIYTAVRGYAADWDNFTEDRGKNGYFFRRPSDGKFEFHHWDSDLAFETTRTGMAFIGGAGGIGWSNFANRPWFRQRFNFYLTELVTKYTRNSPRMQAWLDAMNYQSGNTHANAPFKTSAYNYPVSWFAARETSAMNSGIGLANLNRVFSITTANNQTVATPVFTIDGAASSRTWTVDIAGHPEAVCTFVPTAANNGLWTLTNIALTNGLNALTVRAVASDGAILSSLPFNVTLSVNAPPVAVMTADPSSLRIASNEEIVLDASGSFDPEGTALTYVWTVAPTAGVTVAHSVPGKTEARFQTPGIYTVEVTVRDAALNASVVSREVTVFNSNDFVPFTDGMPLGPQFTVQNAELRDNFSTSAWYSVEDITGRLMIQILEDSAKPLVSSAFTHPLVTRDLPDTADFILQTDLEPDTREFGDWQAGLWLETVEGGSTVRYALSLEGGLNVTVKGAVQPAAYTQSATAAVTGSGATLRIRRAGDSLFFERLAGNVWVTVHTQAIPAGSVASTGGIFVATSNPTTVRISFDYLLVTDPTVTSSVAANLRITEVMYNQAGAGGIEFIELTNIGTQTINLAGVYFEEGRPFGQFTFPAHTLAPGARVLVTNVTPAAFVAAYPAVSLGSIFQWSSGSLNNAGERITLRDVGGNIIHDFSFDDDPDSGWPAAADGGGSSLEVHNTGGNYDDAGNWTASAETGGSPGSHGAAPDADRDGFPDRMEQIAGTSSADGANFFNVTGQPVPTGQKVTWPSYPGRTYHIETSPSLQSPAWTRRGTVVHPAGNPAGTGQFTVTNPAPANTARQFYRVVVELTP